MSKTISININTLITLRLAMERCRHYVAHIHALSHMYEPAGDREGDMRDKAIFDSLRTIASNLEREIDDSTRKLQMGRHRRKAA